jgi:hypothetical protein
MAIGYSNVMNRWNELVMDIYEEWRDDCIENDAGCPSIDSDSYEDYVEVNYCYEVFTDSAIENKALFDITTSGINPCINVPIREAMVVLNDRETWTSLKDTKVILLKDGFEYDSVDVAKCIYDKEPIFADGTCNADYIIEELSIPHLVEFYLANRY